jgi:hypothetical protein
VWGDRRTSLRILPVLLRIARGAPAHGVHGPLDLVGGRELILTVGHERVVDRPRGINQEHGRAGDVPGVDSETVPHAISLRHLAVLVEEDVEWETRLLDIPAHRLRALRHDRDDLKAALRIGAGVVGQFTEPAAAVRSPGAAMKREQHRSVRQELAQRSRLSLLGWKREGGSGREIGSV